MQFIMVLGGIAALIAVIGCLTLIFYRIFNTSGLLKITVHYINGYQFVVHDATIKFVISQKAEPIAIISTVRKVRYIYLHNVDYIKIERDKINAQT